MTIAVGFNCKDGVVVVADSEVCLGPGGKKYAAQFCELRISDSVFLVSAGNVDRTEEIAETLRKAIRRRTGKQLTSAVRAACRSFRRLEGDAPSESKKPFRDLLIAINAGAGAELFRAGDRHFTKVKTFSVVGMESDRAAEMFARFYRHGTDAKSAAYMGIYCMSQLKGFVPGCGGKTRVRTVSSSPFQKQHFSELKIERAEKAYRLFEQELAQVLFKFPDPRIGERQFESHQRRFSTTIQKLRPALSEGDPSEHPSHDRRPRAAAKRSPGLTTAKSVIRFKSRTALKKCDRSDQFFGICLRATAPCATTSG